MNEVRLGAGWATHGRVAVFRIFWRVRQPMLHVHPGLRTFEYDGLSHGVQYATGRRPANSGCLRRYKGGASKPATADCKFVGNIETGHIRRPPVSTSVADLRFAVAQFE
jgi:hypothetical protein